MSLRHIPAVDELLQEPAIKQLLTLYRRDLVMEELRLLLNQLRMELKESGALLPAENLREWVCLRLPSALEQAGRGTLRPVINASGVVLHTNLGRAPLGSRALQHLNSTATGYSNLEMDLERGSRGSRYIHAEALLLRLTGAEAALVVNNNAAAVLLALTVMAQGHEVIVSRGQLIEIGGSFRIPEVMKLSGARLVEVGSTNKTHPQDYRQAVNEDTALLFAAHTSNYKIVGFTAELQLPELVALGRDLRLPVMLDLGSGVMTAPGTSELSPEPTLAQCVQSGIDIISFSGDKLLGGPQAGIILGRREYIDAMKQHQLLRALRVDKLTLAALEGTLLEYLCGDPEQNLPVLRMLSRHPDDLAREAAELCQLLRDRLVKHPKIKHIEVTALNDMVGGGAYPLDQLCSYGVELRFHNISLERISAELRQAQPAIIARRQDQALLLSVRCLLPGESQLVADIFANLPCLNE